MNNRYILITSARNEDNFIENTINSVLSQSILPLKWIIVNDHSEDRTEEIVIKYSNKYSFINLINFEGQNVRNFASKVFAIKTAYDIMRYLEFDFIGILDADITFESNYYELIISEFYKNSKLGIAGGGFFDVYNGKKIKIPYSPYIVRGAVQLFRKECYEDINGFLPLEWGGEDTIACATARMKGWEIQTFEQYSVMHNRKTASVGDNQLLINFHLGKRDYHRGLISLVHFSKCISKITNKPFILGSIFQFFGYWGSKLKREKLIIDNDLLNFIINEQKDRIKKFLRIK